MKRFNQCLLLAAFSSSVCMVHPALAGGFYQSVTTGALDNNPVQVSSDFSGVEGNSVATTSYYSTGNYFDSNHQGADYVGLEGAGNFREITQYSGLDYYINNTSAPVTLTTSCNVDYLGMRHFTDTPLLANQHLDTSVSFAFNVARIPAGGSVASAGSSTTVWNAGVDYYTDASTRTTLSTTGTDLGWGEVGGASGRHNGPEVEINTLNFSGSPYASGAITLGTLLPGEGLSLQSIMTLNQSGNASGGNYDQLYAQSPVCPGWRKDDTDCYLYYSGGAWSSAKMNFNGIQIAASAVPESDTTLMLLTGLVLVAGMGWRQRQKKRVLSLPFLVGAR